MPIGGQLHPTVIHVDRGAGQTKGDILCSAESRVENKLQISLMQVFIGDALGHIGQRLHIFEAKAQPQY